MQGMNCHDMMHKGLDRREFIRGLAGASAFALGGRSLADTLPSPGMPATLPRPTAQQLLWHDLEFGMFYHFDITVFKPDWYWRTWKDKPTPDLYNPDKLDTDQWMEAAKAMGAKYVVFVAKHGSGFLQWQSNAYDYGLRQAKWRGGKGDVVRDFVESARRAGLKPGLYASIPANGWFEVDRGLVNRGKGGDVAAQRRYSAVCEKMCTELWRDYGELFEIWFDGGALKPSEGGPDLVPILRKYQPNALLFQGPEDAGNIIRWPGNERGAAPYPNWSAAPCSTQEGGDREMMNHGMPDGRIWAPGECDVPLYPGKWFWHEIGKTPRWSNDQLIDMYYRSVGRNCNLLLNATPDNHGLVPERDIETYRWFGEMVRQRSRALASVDGKGPGDRLELVFDRPTLVNQVALQEDQREGIHVLKYAVEGELAEGGVKTLCEGSSLGHKRIQMFEPVAVKKLVLRVTETRGVPLLRSLAAMNIPGRIVQS